MALELIYTSVPRGLRAGASGYCTVAQTSGMREDLAAALERRSLFAHEPKDDSPVYFSFRILSLGGSNWRVLSRAQDAGLDFTGRRHYLVHHLVLEISEEVLGVQPAEILLGWQGWRRSWVGPPGQLEGLRAADLSLNLARIGLPAQEWKRQTGDAGWAAFPCRMPSPVGWLAMRLSSVELLRLMGESTALMESTQKGGSWLTTLDAGGPANPILKDCLWSGRTDWKRATAMSGVRSILRIEECLGDQPNGRAEDIEMARTGQGRSVTQIKNVAFRASVPDSGISSSLPTEEEVGARFRWKRLFFVGTVLLGAAGAGFLFLGRSPNSSSPTPESGEIKKAEVFSPMTPPPVVIQQPSDSPGQFLRQALWSEAGGKEQIQKLHLLFGKPVSSGLIEDEIDLLLLDGGDARSLRGPADWVGPISLETEAGKKNFSRKAARETTAWTLFLQDSHHGLACIPDLFRVDLERKVPAKGRSPKEILKEIPESIFLGSERWLIVLNFPSGDEAVQIDSQKDDKYWIDLVNQHRERILGKRMEALQRLAPFLGENPEKLDERKIRDLIAGMKYGTPSEVFKEFLELNEEYTRWWLPPKTGDTPGAIFRRLLENPEVRAEVQLDKLAVGRLIP